MISQDGYRIQNAKSPHKYWQTVRNSAAWCLAKTIIIPKPAREGRYGGQYCCTSSILSAVFKAKADTKDGADGFSRKRETITFFYFFRCPKLLFGDLQR